MDRADALGLLARLHGAQNAFYAGGRADFDELLSDDVRWTIPGDNAIAGTYVGRAAVLAYFARRRDLAHASFQMHARDVLVGEGNTIAALTDGAATIDGVDHRWSTVGLYEVSDGLVSACWLLALDQAAFDAVWSTGS